MRPTRIAYLNGRSSGVFWRAAVPVLTVAALSAGCSGGGTDAAAHSLLQEAVAAISGVEAVQGTLTHPGSALVGDPPEPSPLSFTIDSDKEIATKHVLMSFWGDDPPTTVEKRVVAGVSYWLLPVDADVFGLSPGPVWQEDSLPDTNPFVDSEDVLQSALLAETVCVLLPESFPVNGCDPLASVGELAAAGVEATVVSEPSDADPVTEIRFKVPLDKLADPGGLAYLQDVYGAAVSGRLSGVALDVTVWVDAQSRIRGARFDPNQLRSDTLRAVGVDSGEAGQDSDSFLMSLSFDLYDEGLDVEAPPPDRVLASADVWRLLEERDQANASASGPAAPPVVVEA